MFGKNTFMTIFYEILGFVKIILTLLARKDAAKGGAGDVA